MGSEPRIRLKFGLVAWVVMAFVSGCVTGVPAEQAKAEVVVDLASGCIAPLALDLPEDDQDTLPVDPDFRVVDRGIQSGLSKTAGWPESCFEVSEAFLEPWPTDFSRKELIDSAMARTIDYMRGLPEGHPQRPLTIHFEPGFPLAHRYWVEAIAAESMKAIGGDVYLEGVHLIVGDSVYLRETLTTLKPREFVGGFCGNDEAPAGDIFFCAEDDIAMARFGRLIDQGVLSDNGLWTSVVPHEMFHTFQAFHREKFQIESGQDEPRWMSEGSAEFFGFAMSQLAGVSSYYVSVWDWTYYLPNPELGLQEFEDPITFPYPAEEYWMGQMATEYLVASLGFEVLLDIYREYGSTGDFEASFEAATGLALMDFYQRFDEAYRNLFSNNVELVEFPDRECPTYWGDCTVFRGDPGFIEQSGVQAETGTQDPNACGEDWWLNCAETRIELPTEAENSNHGLPVNDPLKIGPPSCEGLRDQARIPNGIAATFAYRDASGADLAMVSTQWYVRLQLLDSNLDGVICSPEVPE